MVEEEPQNSISIIDSLISTYQNEISYELGEAYFGKGYAHFEISEYEESILAYQNSLKVFKQIKDSCYQKRVYYNLGASLNMIGDHLGASKYYLKSIEIENCKDFEYSKAADHYNLAILFADIGLTEDAIKQYQLAKATDSIGDNITFKQLSKMGLAIEYFFLDQTFNAVKIYKNVLKQSVNDTLDQKNNQILKLSQAEEHSKSKINNLKNSFYFFIGILIVLGIFLVFINKERKKVKGLNKSLNDLLEEKNRIMTVLSHDLRSPITAVKGIIDLLKLNILTTEEKEKMIIELESSINDLNSNLNTLLEWALTNKNNAKPTFKNVNVKKTIEKVFVFLRQQADQKNIKLSISTSSDSITTFVDANHLELIIRNIVSNAIKFSYPNSEVELIVTTENSKVKISIKDLGIGLSEKELDQIRAFKKLREMELMAKKA